MNRSAYPRSYDRKRPVRYWRQDIPHEKQNFGDYLSELFVDRIFVNPSFPADAYHLIGSVISDHWIEHSLWSVGAEAGTVAFWLCGLRDEQGLSPEARRKAAFFGARGPMTRDALGLPKTTVLGDPGFLTPLACPAARRRASVARRSLCIPHFVDPIDDEAALAATGADFVLRPGIDGRESALVGMIDAIANADFVLTGALHGAIIACAYGALFAFFEDGFVDTPFKWRDFSDSIGVPCDFVRSVEQGREWHREAFLPKHKRPQLTPMLAIAPFAARHTIMIAALREDGVLSPQASHEVMSLMRSRGVDDPDSIRRAQLTLLDRLAER